MDMSVSLGAAFLAGLISFLSPCVLPLVPPYLCFITGASLDELSEGERVRHRQTMLDALMFVLGFTTVFVLLGATASTLGQMLRSQLPLLAQIAGVVIILMGVHFLGLFKFSLFAREARYQHNVKPAGMFGSYAIGLAFAFGWTPCIGPVLATILAVAASTESVGTGAFLLGVYSLGLGVPFLIAAYGVDRFVGFMKRFRKHLGMVEKAMGVMLILAGIGFLTGAHQTFALWLLETFPALQNLG
jgi:cytochrome c-type biogenesis protein